MRYFTLIPPISLTLLALSDVGKPYVAQNITHYTGELPVIVGLISFLMFFMGYLFAKKENA